MSENKENTLEKLNNFNFSTEDDFNIEENYQILIDVENQKKDSKYLDSEVKVNKAAEEGMVDKESFDDINKFKDNLYSFIRKYDPNQEYTASMSESEKTKLFGLAKYLLTEYTQKLNNLKFNIILNYKQIHFLNNVLTKKLEYDGNDVFTYTELMARYWKGVQEIMNKLDQKNNEQSLFEIDITTVTYLHHLLSKFKVKGATEEYYHFRDILYKLNETNSLFENFKILYERINTNFTIWTTSITENQSVKGTVLESNEVNVE